MDISVTDSRKTWPPLAVVALLAIAAIAAYVLVSPEAGSRHRSTPTPPGAPVILEQAPWRIETYGMGGGSKLTKQERTRLRVQRAPLTRLVKDLHAALFLEPSTRRRIVGRLFSSSAAGPFLSARPGLLADAEAVKTVWRRGRIGIQADGARRAAGTVAIVARVGRGEEAIRLGYRSDFFLEKSDGRWKVVAFETDQRRLPEPTAKERNRDDDKKERRDGKEGKSK